MYNNYNNILFFQRSGRFSAAVLQSINGYNRFARFGEFKSCACNDKIGNTTIALTIM